MVCVFHLLIKSSLFLRIKIRPQNQDCQQTLTHTEIFYWTTNLLKSKKCKDVWIWKADKEKQMILYQIHKHKTE